MNTINAKEILQNRLGLCLDEPEPSCQRINEIEKILDPDLKALLTKLKKRRIILAIIVGADDKAGISIIIEAHGLSVLDVGTGAHELHTTREYLNIKEFVEAAKFCYALIQER